MQLYKISNHFRAAWTITIAVGDSAEKWKQKTKQNDILAVNEIAS